MGMISYNIIQFILLISIRLGTCTEVINRYFQVDLKLINSFNPIMPDIIHLLPVFLLSTSRQQTAVCFLSSLS